MSQTNAAEPVAPVTPAGTRPRQGFRSLRTWLLVALWTALLAVAFHFDEDISTWVRQAAPEKSWALRLLKLSRYPFYTPVYVAVGVILLVDPVKKRLSWDLRHRRQFIGFAVALAACFGATHAIKFITGRTRPHQTHATTAGQVTSEAQPAPTADSDSGHSPYDFDLFGDPEQRQDSMPSAHTVQFVLLAVLLWLYFPPTAWLTVPLLVPACLSRVAQGQHYLSDVIAGAGLTLIIVQICRDLLGREFYPRLWPPRRPADSSPPPL